MEAVLLLQSVYRDVDGLWPIWAIGYTKIGLPQGIRLGDLLGTLNHGGGVLGALVLPICTSQGREGSAIEQTCRFQGLRVIWVDLIREVQGRRWSWTRSSPFSYKLS